MEITEITVGAYQTNCYIVTSDDKSAVIVDPGAEANKIIDKAKELGAKVKYILLTHGHFDHVGAVNEIYKATGCTVYINERDEGYKVGMSGMLFKLPEGGKTYDEGDVIVEAGLAFKVLATPGHTPGGVSLVCENALFVGDTMFRGSCGRTDLPGGDMTEELKSLKKLCALPGDYEVYPGHMDSTTLERERRFNYYCREAMKY